MQETPAKSTLEGAALQSDHKRLELSGKMKAEPLLMDNPGRFVLFPIQHEDVSRLTAREPSHLWDRTH